MQYIKMGDLKTLVYRKENRKVVPKPNTHFLNVKMIEEKT